MTTSAYRLDPPTSRLIELMKQSGAPSYADVTPAEARLLALKSGEVVDIPKPTIAHVSDHVVPGPAGPIPVRRYSEQAPGAAGLPTLIYYHGGGFVVGDLDSHDTLCRSLALAAGCQVLAVDYRLAPEHPFPAATDDAAAAFAWVAANGRELGIDTDRLAVGGDSAGGTLAALAALQARDNAKTLKAQVLFYPVVDLVTDYPSKSEHADKPPIQTHVLDWFWDHYLGANRRQDLMSDVRVSPLRAESLAGVAPAYVMTAGQDPLRDEGAAYAARLSSAGVECTYQCVTGTIHAFLRMGRYIPAAGDVVAAAGAFLRARL
ncbi:MAG: alpha/beta hydrolase [Hyphomicrobiaceae bacterium]